MCKIQQRESMCHIHTRWGCTVAENFIFPLNLMSINKIIYFWGARGSWFALFIGFLLSLMRLLSPKLFFRNLLLEIFNVFVTLFEIRIKCHGVRLKRCEINFTELDLFTDYFHKKTQISTSKTLHFCDNLTHDTKVSIWFIKTRWWSSSFKNFCFLAIFLLLLLRKTFINDDRASRREVIWLFKRR